MVTDVGMLYSPRVMSREVNITFDQRTFLGTSANQKRHYLKSYNNEIYCWEILIITINSIVSIILVPINNLLSYTLTLYMVQQMMWIKRWFVSLYIYTGWRDWHLFLSDGSIYHCNNWHFNESTIRAKCDIIVHFINTTKTKWEKHTILCLIVQDKRRKLIFIVLARLINYP